MKLEIKCLEGTTWTNLPIENILGTSVAKYLASSEKPIVAAVYEDGQDKPIAFITNRQKYHDMYKDKGICFTAEDILLLFDESNPALPLVAAELPGAQLCSVEVLR